MPKCTIDGKEVEFAVGQNLVEVAKTAGIEIPVFCYHSGMTVVAQCRMCAVEIEKMPKLQTACSTPATEGMVVKTKSERTVQNQKSVMEFLLINHPLDCPICDKAGECDLQDHSFKYGDSNTRYTEERRTYLDLDMGPVIKKNMNRCIHCTRCIRFGDEVANIREMVAVQRGNNTEITTIDGRPLETDYAGNYADVCPTGSLTLKDFRFRKRAWFLKKTPTICEGCSKGCNLELHHDAGVVYRSVPRVNMEINKYWLCDEGRFNFHYTVDPERITQPMVSKAGALVKSTWDEAVTQARGLAKGKKILTLIGADLTQEEVELLKQVMPGSSNNTEMLSFASAGVSKMAEDAPADKILKRKSKVSNLTGLEKLGIKPYSGLAKDVGVVILFRGGRAQIPVDVKGVPVIAIGVYQASEAKNFDVVMPGASFAEKDGTIFNYEGREQKLRRAVLPPGDSKMLSEILMLWSRKGEHGATKTGVA